MTAETDPLAALDETTRRYRRTEKAHEQAQKDVTAAVVAALRAGARPTDVANRSPFSAAYVRRIARDHGIKATPRGSRSPEPNDA